MPNPPELNFTIGSDDERSIEMRGFCIGFKWFANVLHKLAPDSDVKIRYYVQYESGGVFDPIESEFEYDYRADRH